MSWIESLSASPVVLALGWTLLHFLWQGTLVAGTVALALAVLRHASASTRYLVCCGGLAAMLLMPLVTLLVELRPAGTSPADPGPAAALDGGLLARGDGLTRVLPALVLVWLAGALAFEARLFLHWLGARRLRRRRARPAPARVQLLVAELADRLGIRRRVAALESGLARVPAVMGWWRPVVLLPSCVLTGLTPDQLRAVLAHELAHVRRHDYLVNLAQGVIEALLFYHPATWWLGHRLRCLREYSCDDSSVALCGDAMSFARALASLDELAATGSPGAAVPSSPATLGATGGSAMDRIRRLFGLPVAETPRPAAWALPLVLTVGLSGAVALATPAQEAAPRDESPALHVVLRHKGSDDVVDLGRRVDERTGGILARLREAGASDDMLLAVLMELEPASPEVAAAAERALRHGRRVHEKVTRHLAGIEAQLDRAVAEGTLTEEQAHEELHAVERKIHTELMQRVQGAREVRPRRQVEHLRQIERLEEVRATTTDPEHLEAIEEELEHLRHRLHEEANVVRFGEGHEAHGDGVGHVVVEARRAERKAKVAVLAQQGVELEQSLAQVEVLLAETTEAPVRVELERKADVLTRRLEETRHAEHRLRHDLAQLGGEQHEARTAFGPLHDGPQVVVPGVERHVDLFELVRDAMAERGRDEAEIDEAVERIHGQALRLRLREVAEDPPLVESPGTELERLHRQLVEELRESGLDVEPLLAELHQRLADTDTDAEEEAPEETEPPH